MKKTIGSSPIGTEPIIVSGISSKPTYFIASPPSYEILRFIVLFLKTPSSGMSTNEECLDTNFFDGEMVVLDRND